MLNKSILWIGAAMLLGTWVVMVQAVSDSHLRNRLREYGYASTVEEIREAYEVEYPYGEAEPRELLSAAASAKRYTDDDLWEHIPIDGAGDLGSLTEPISDVMARAIYEYFELNGPALDLAYRAAAVFDGHLEEQVHDPSDVTLEYGTKQRALLRMLAIDGLRHLLLGDEKGVADAIIAQCRVADSNREETLLVSQVRRGAFISMATGSLEVLVNRSILSEESLMRIDSVLLSIGSTVFEDRQRALACDSLASYQIQSDYMLDQAAWFLGGKHLALNTQAPALFSDAFFVSGLGVSDRVIMQFNTFRALIANELEPFILSEEFYLFRNKRFASVSRARELFAGTTGTGEAIVVSPQWSLALIRMSRTLLALERFHRSNQFYPESLETLVPGYFERLLIDTFSGQPLGYIHYDDHVVVYSYGQDREDDAGQIDEEYYHEGDMVMELYKPEFRALIAQSEDQHVQ